MQNDIADVLFNSFFFKIYTEKVFCSLLPGFIVIFFEESTFNTNPIKYPIVKTSIKFALHIIFGFTALSSFAGTPFSSSPSNITMLSTFLVTAHGNMADGNRVVFSTQYSNAVDGNDAIKLTNPGENFGLLRDGKVLAVEARQPIKNGDSLFYDMWHLIPQQYKLIIVPEYINVTGISCILFDKFLNTRTPISLRDTNRLVLNITADPASSAVNRLIIIFSADRIIEPPIKFTHVSAVTDDYSGTAVNWKVEQELDVDHYEIERGSDNEHFAGIFTTSPVYNTMTGGEYKFTDLSSDNSANLYRIKSLSKSGTSSYSPVFKASVTALKTTLNVYPNPVVNNKVEFRLLQGNISTYRIQLSNNTGLIVYTKTIKVTSQNYMETLSLPGSISKGNYLLSVFGEDGSIVTKKLIIQ